MFTCERNFLHSFVRSLTGYFDSMDPFVIALRLQHFLTDISALSGGGKKESRAKLLIGAIGRN